MFIICNVKKSVNLIQLLPLFQLQVANDLIGYAFSIGALVLSAFGSVLTKKITQQFDKMVIALYLGISIGIVGWLQVRQNNNMTSLV